MTTPAPDPTQVADVLDQAMAIGMETPVDGVAAAATALGIDPGTMLTTALAAGFTVNTDTGVITDPSGNPAATYPIPTGNTVALSVDPSTGNPVGLAILAPRPGAHALTDVIPAEVDAPTLTGWPTPPTV